MAFSDCSGLKSFYSKYASADNRCLIVDGTLNSFAPAGLTSYTIPNSVTAIGDNAFSNCSGLKEVTVLNEEPANIELGTTVFDKDLVANCSLYVPVESKSLYVKAGTWKDFSPILEIGESPYITGDANGDGKVNVSDIAIIIDYMLERNPSGFNKDAADVNADGKINVIDISGIIQILLAK